MIDREPCARLASDRVAIALTESSDASLILRRARLVGHRNSRHRSNPRMQGLIARSHTRVARSEISAGDPKALDGADFRQFSRRQKSE